MPEHAADCAAGDLDLALNLLLNHTPLPPTSEILHVLAELGGPYTLLANCEAVAFEVDIVGEQRKLLRHLEDAKLISSFTKKRGRDTCDVVLN